MMKDYVKPEVEFIDLVAEAIADDGDDTPNLGTSTNPW